MSSVLAAGAVALSAISFSAIIGGAFEIEELFAAKVAALRGGCNE